MVHGRGAGPHLALVAASLVVHDLSLVRRLNLVLNLVHVICPHLARIVGRLIEILAQDRLGVTLPYLAGVAVGMMMLGSYPSGITSIRSPGPSGPAQSIEPWPEVGPDPGVIPGPAGLPDFRSGLTCRRPRWRPMVEERARGTRGRAPPLPR